MTTCCSEMFEVHNTETAHVTLTTPRSGKIFIDRVGLATVSQCTKFEVSRFTRYEAMNGSAKCRKWGGLGADRGHSRSWAIPTFDGAPKTSYSTSIETICLSFTILPRDAMHPRY